MVPFSLPLPEAWGNFSLIYCGDLVKLLEVNLTILWGMFNDRVPPEVFNSQSCLLSLQQFVNYISGFPTQYRFPWSFPILSFCSGQLWLPEFACLSLQSQRFALFSSLSYGSKKRCWFFSLFSFLLFVRIDWQLPSSLQVELENKSLFYLYV